MLYPYMQLFDGTEVVHSQIFDQNCVKVHFERPNDEGYCFATCELPTYKWDHVEGFSSEEFAFLQEFVQHNAHLIYEYAEGTS